jgi:hypothetical protein
MTDPSDTPGNRFQSENSSAIVILDFFIDANLLSEYFDQVAE